MDKISWEEIVKLTEDDNTDVYLLPDEDNTELFSMLNINENSDQVIIIEANEDDNEVIEITDNVENEDSNPPSPLHVELLDVPDLHKNKQHIDINDPKFNLCIKNLKENNMKHQLILKEHFGINIKLDKTKTNTTYECNLCDRVFVHPSGLNRHKTKHAEDLIPKTNVKMFPEQHIIKCIVCGRIFATIDQAFVHIIKDHQNNWLAIQDIFFNNNCHMDEELLKLVIKDEDVKRNTDSSEKESKENIIVNDINQIFDVFVISSVFQCEFCEYLFMDIHCLINHEISHDPSVGYECRACSINVGSSKEISKHWQFECVFENYYEEFEKVNIQRQLICNICYEPFKTLDQLYNHRYITCHLFPRFCNSAVTVGCELCGKVFDNAKLLLLHNKEEHLNKSVKLADSTIKSRQFLCDVCGKSYTQSSHLWQHLRFHKGIKPFACSEPNCSRKFTIRPDLNDHIRKCHTRERPYQCMVCGKRFLTGSVYYQHRLIHRGERRYGCEECGKRFYRADALKNHTRIHTGEKPYPCEYCTKAFRQRGDKDKHIRARHACITKDFMKQMSNATKNGNVYIGEIAFPQSMFQPLMRDIDGSQ